MAEHTILAVDDEEVNLDIMEKYLQKSGHRFEAADSGAAAWELLSGDPQRYSLVLLDRMMPGVGGMEVLERIKSHEVLKHIPVVMQTAAASPEQISEGIARGVYYYLTKPFKREVLLAVVEAALQDYMAFLELKNKLEETRYTVHSLDEAVFTFRTIAAGKDIVNLLAHAAVEPIELGIALTELVVNAVEHGNLGIGYDEKSRLLQENSWEKEIEKRLDSPGYREKKVTLRFKKLPPGEQDQPNRLQLTIKDEGEGFDWRQYLQLSPARMLDTHGRGILMANNSVEWLEYNDKGSSVTIWTRAQGTP